MIRMEKYTKAFEQEYFDVVKVKVSKDMQEELIKSATDYFPHNFFDSKKTTESNFRKLICADYKQIRKLYEYIKDKASNKHESECFEKDSSGKRKRKKLYQDYFKTYNSVRDSLSINKKMSVRVIEESGILVCPYCNRDYVNCRADNIAGAQLDHFYNRADYPIFALCLYNFIPSCYNCNHIKSAKADKVISPFDSRYDMDKLIKFSYNYSTDVLKINTKNTMVKTHIDTLRLREAYSIHKVDAKELYDKKEEYVDSLIDEMNEMLKPLKKKVDKKLVYSIVFDEELNTNDYKKKSLAKMKADLMKDLKIYGL